MIVTYIRDCVTEDEQFWPELMVIHDFVDAVMQSSLDVDGKTKTESDIRHVEFVVVS